MKKNILNIIGIIFFLISTAIIYIALTYYRKPDSVDLQNIAGFYGEKENTLDVVYIGGSASFVYWEPLKAYEDAGITSYLFGANSISAELYEYMVREVYSKQNPNLIIIDARAFEYRDDYFEPNDISYYNVLTGTPLNKNKINFINKNVPKYLNQNVNDFIFDLNKYHTSNSLVSVKDRYRIMKQTYKNRKKGFFFVPKAQRQQKQKTKTKEIKELSKETTQILEDLITELKKHDAEVLFIVSPYVETKEEKKEYNYIEKIITESGYDFLDTNDYIKEMKIDYDTDFYNYNHVNIFGAEKYTTYLTKYLKNNYKLLDRRIDKNYKSWDKLLNDWNEQVKTTKEQTQKIIDGVGYDEYIYIKDW